MGFLGIIALSVVFLLVAGYIESGDSIENTDNIAEVAE